MSKIPPVTIHFKEDSIPGVRHSELTQESKDELYTIISTQVIGTKPLPDGVDNTCARLLRDEQLTALNKLFGREE